MNVVVIQLTDESDTTPLTSWFNDHTDVTVNEICNNGLTFYVFYQ